MYFWITFVWQMLKIACHIHKHDVAVKYFRVIDREKYRIIYSKNVFKCKCGNIKEIIEWYKDDKTPRI
jgi:hypothetical protein